MFFEYEEQHDGQVVYKTDGVADPIFIFHFSYDSMRRWYIGSTLGSDYDVLAFIDDVNGDFAKDGVTQIWSEYLSQTEEWTDNINMKAQLTVNQYAQNSDQKAPPQQRDERDFRKRTSNRGPPQNKPNHNNNRTPPNQRGNNQNQQNENQNNRKVEKSEQKKPGQRSPEDEREDRRKQMFRRVNKLDLEVESSGKFESGINVRDEPDVIISGSDDPELNTVFFIQPVQYNGKAVYKSGAGSYLYFVRYAEV